MKLKFLIPLFLCLLNAQDSVVQTRANKIQDSKLLVQTHGEKPRCLNPTYFDGDIFLRVQDCKGASIARYDVFKRLAFNFNGEWLCLSLRDGLTQGVGNKDHIVLRPCVLNDSTQWFDIVDGKISLSKYPSVKLTEFKNLVLASSVKFGNEVQVFRPVMQEWITALAPPVNYDVRTTIAFKTLDPKTRAVQTYFLNPKGASTKGYNFFYSPTNGYIKTYNTSKGTFECLTSYLQNEGATFISWRTCPQVNLPPSQDPASWNLDFYTSSFIFDASGNMLEVARGTDFGKLFVTTKEEYKKKSLYTSDFSGLFIFNKAVDELRNFIAQNISFQSDTCGNQRRFKRDAINDAIANFDPSKGGWGKKFFDISTSTDGQNNFNGICGYCLLQSYEILALLTEIYPRVPEIPQDTNVGYFFNYAQNTNPLISFEARSPSLSRTLFFAFNYWGDAFYSNEPLYLRASRAVEAATRITLPRRGWELRTPIFTYDLIQEEVQRILQSPPGSVFLALINTNPNVAFDGHAMPVIRTNQGVIVIPTNLSNANLTDYSLFIQPLNDVNEIIHRLSTNGSYTITALNFIHMREPVENPLDSLLGQNDCSGEGSSSRRGNGLNLNPNNANSCNGQRCSLMEWEDSLN